MVFLQNIIDIAAYNAYVVFYAVYPDNDRGKIQRRRLFLEKLAGDMITPAIEQSQHKAPKPDPIPRHHFAQKNGASVLGAACVHSKLIEKRQEV